MRRFKRIGYLLAVNLLLILFCSIQALVVSAQNKPMDVKENISENKMEEVDPEIYEKNFRAMTAAELTSGKHRYDNGIYDGAVYYLKNFKQGTYLDLKGGSNANGTSVVTSAYQSSSTQKFKLQYLGMSLYELIPYGSSQIIVNVAANTEEGNVNISTRAPYTTNQKFKLKMLDSNKAIIYTQVSDYTKALCFDNTTSDNVVQKSYAGLSAVNRGYAEWILQNTDSSVYDSYTKYYLKNLKTGLYLDVPDYSTSNMTMIQLRRFTGGENQQWKTQYNTATNTYTFAPAHRADMALEAFQTAFIQAIQTSSDTQKFHLESASSESAAGTVYKISVALPNYTLYLNAGNELKEERYSTVIGTSMGDLWALEEVEFDYAGMDSLAMNTACSKSISSYGELQYFTFRTDFDARFKVELTRITGNAIMGVYLNADADRPAFTHIYNTSAGQIYNVFLKADTTYYISVFDSQNTIDAAYTLRVRQFVAYLHGMNTSLTDTDIYGHSPDPDGNRRIQAEQNAAKMNAHGFWAHTNTEADMTPDFVLNTIDPVTGLPILDSDIYIFDGHASYQSAEYNTGTSSQVGNDGHLSISMLPSLNNCELIVWAGCNSAWGYTNITSKSVEKGAKTALGFEQSTTRPYSNRWILAFVDELLLGKTVQEAADLAVAAIQVNLDNFGLGTFIIYGDEDNIIFPANENSYIVQPRSIVSLPDGYTLVSSTNPRIKRYERQINGVSTNDAYTYVYNKRGETIGVFESKYHITENEFIDMDHDVVRQTLERKMEEGLFEEPGILNVSDYYLVLEGRPVPSKIIEKEITDAEGNCSLDVKILNLLTGELISPEEVGL